MEFLFQNRGAGKRQVKPSQDIALLEDQLGGESSDDSEYRVDSDRDRGDDSADSEGKNYFIMWKMEQTDYYISVDNSFLKVIKKFMSYTSSTAYKMLVVST